jgi:MerR family copper efflux transcriptional regulator
MDEIDASRDLPWVGNFAPIPAADAEVVVHGPAANIDTPVVGLAAMDALTIHEAAETTGWSPRMLRYVERAGLVSAHRSPSGYRLYGPAELQRLRTLRQLLSRFELGLAEMGFARRLRREPELRAAIDAWLDAHPQRPAHVAPGDWLRWEQDKHEKLLAA